MIVILGIHQGEGSGPSLGSHHPPRGLRGSETSSPRLLRGRGTGSDALHTGAPPQKSLRDTKPRDRMRDIRLGVVSGRVDEGTLDVPRFHPTQRMEMAPK